MPADLTVVDGSFVEDPYWIESGDPVSGDTSSAEGVANRVARELLSNLNQIRLNDINPIRRTYKHINGVNFPAPVGENPSMVPNAGLNVDVGDYVIVDYRAAESGNIPADTRINLPTNADNGDSVRVRRIGHEAGANFVIPTIHVYRGTGSSNPIIDATTVARSWPIDPTAVDEGVSGAGLSIARQNVSNRDIETARPTRIDDLTFTWRGTSWRAQPTALVSPAVEPLLALLESVRNTIDTAIDGINADLVDASEDDPGLVQLAPSTASGSRDSANDTDAVTPAGVDAALDAHEADFDASNSQKGHIETATATELNSSSPPADKAVTANRRAATGQYGLGRLVSRSQLTADTLASAHSDFLVSAEEFRNYVIWRMK